MKCARWMAAVVGILAFALASVATEGLAVSNEWQSTATYSNPRGTGTVNGSGSVVRENSAATFYAEHSGENPNGTTWQSTTTGTGQKTADGFESQSTTVGATADGHGWTTVRTVDATKSTDGTMTIERTATKTLDNGMVIKRDSETTVTKTDNGATWQTTGTQTGPKGTATMTGSGTATKSADGVQFDSQRSVVGAQGKTWQSTTTGAGGGQCERTRTCVGAGNHWRKAAAKGNCVNRRGQ